MILDSPSLMSGNFVLQRAALIEVDMNVANDTVTFEQCDMAFVRKFGAEKAAEMVLDYKSFSPLPFIYDMDQLSECLGVGKKTLYYLAENGHKEYNAMALKKRNGKVRHIYSPNDILKNCQKNILNRIIDKMPVSDYASAYIKGKTLRDNAVPHIGKKYLLKLDITDFFGSICFEQAYGAVFNTRYFPKQIGVILTKLCFRKNLLPQGAPTSPAVSNIVMRNFDDNMGSWCKNHGITYTRYCDDMTFSSDKPLYMVYQKAKAMLEEMGFELNENKTHFVKDSNRQTVTGLTVNEKLTVSKDYKRELRQAVHYVLKFGAAEDIIRGGRKEFLSDGIPDTERYCNHLLGKIRYVLQIEPNNLWFQNAFAQLSSYLNVLQ